MGLPLFETAALLEAAGVPRWRLRAWRAMSTEILINASMHEARAAVVENGVLQEVFLERASRRGLISNIYKGRVSRVLPGMQAAFIEIGMERTAFLHASDIFDRAPRGHRHRGAAHRKHPLAGRRGQRDPGAGGQGPARHQGRAPDDLHHAAVAAIWSTCRRAAASAYRRASRTRAERERLRAAVAGRPRAPRRMPDTSCAPPRRTAPAEALRADMMYLRKLWEFVRQKGLRTGPGNLVHADLPLHLRVLRDLLRRGRRTRAGRSAERASRDAGIRGRLHARGAAAHRAVRPRRARCSSCTTSRRRSKRRWSAKCPLKSGGHLIIDQTEAMTTIDVNTGAFVGHRNLEETIFRTNLEAAVAIARQLRLRNLGGIIIIDFIDMEEPEHRRQVHPGAGEGAERGSRQDQHLLGFAARAGGDDAQAHARKPGTSAVPAVSDLRGPRVRQDGGNGLLRGVSRDRAPGAPVRVPTADGARAPGRDRAAAR